MFSYWDVGMTTMTNMQYCLQCKTQWTDGDSWWTTTNFSNSFDTLVEEHLPPLMQHNKEEYAKDNMIMGHKYRIVLEIVMANDKYLRSVT